MFKARKARKYTDSLRAVQLALNSGDCKVSYREFIKIAESMWLRVEERTKAEVPRSAATELAIELAAELKLVVDEWSPFGARNMLRSSFDFGVFVCWAAPQMLPALRNLQRKDSLPTLACPHGMPRTKCEVCLNEPDSDHVLDLNRTPSGLSCDPNSKSLESPPSMGGVANI